MNTKVEFRRILCATDLSDFSNQAVAYAVAMAKAFEAKLFLSHIVHLPSFVALDAPQVYPADLFDRLAAQAKDQLANVMAQEDIEWEPLVTNGPVAGMLAKLVADKGIDLLVSATHGRSGIKRLLLGSVTERIIRTLPCPLLTVSPVEHTFDASSVQTAGFKKILVGCDYSLDGDRAVRFGLSLAQEFQSDLRLVHVIEPFAYHNHFIPQGIMETSQTRLCDDVTAKLQARVPPEAGNWCKISTQCLRGKPFDELIRYADHHAIDLIIVGARGHSLVESMLLGSTTDRVIRHATCPVLCVGNQASATSPESSR